MGERKLLVFLRAVCVYVIGMKDNTSVKKSKKNPKTTKEIKKKKTKNSQSQQFKKQKIKDKNYSLSLGWGQVK